MWQCSFRFSRISVLAITKGIVERLGGTVRLDEDVAKGALNQFDGMSDVIQQSVRGSVAEMEEYKLKAEDYKERLKRGEAKAKEAGPDGADEFVVRQAKADAKTNRAAARKAAAPQQPQPVRTTIGVPLGEADGDLPCAEVYTGSELCAILGSSA